MRAPVARPHYFDAADYGTFAFTGSPYRDFGRWIKDRKQVALSLATTRPQPQLALQVGFRHFDTGQEVGAFNIRHTGSGTLEEDELVVAVHTYLEVPRAVDLCITTLRPRTALLRGRNSAMVPCSLSQRNPRLWRNRRCSE